MDTQQIKKTIRELVRQLTEFDATSTFDSCDLCKRLTQIDDTRRGSIPIQSWKRGTHTVDISVCLDCNQMGWDSSGVAGFCAWCYAPVLKTGERHRITNRDHKAALFGAARSRKSDLKIENLIPMYSTRYREYMLVCESGCSKSAYRINLNEGLMYRLSLKFPQGRRNEASRWMWKVGIEDSSLFDKRVKLVEVEDEVIGVYFRPPTTTAKTVWRAWVPRPTREDFDSGEMRLEDIPFKPLSRNEMRERGWHE